MQADVHFGFVRAELFPAAEPSQRSNSTMHETAVIAIPAKLEDGAVDIRTHPVVVSTNDHRCLSE